jgi:diguanylate cyclase (GGDEF)-like protein
LEIIRGGRYVLDFRHGSVLGRFEHRLQNDEGRVVAEVSGGLAAAEAGPFFLRHGREVDLGPGHYQVLTRLESPYFITPPQPYVDTLDHYRQAIKPGNALTLLCLGVFIGLGTFYAVLAAARQQWTEGLYAAFIAGNLLYNASGLGVAHELLGIRWFHLSSAPILLSNMAYVGFVMTLLRLRTTAPRLYRLGLAALLALACMAGVALWRPSWAMEMCRVGVGVFLAYGLTAGILRARAGDRLARSYLLANVGFAITGSVAITLGGMGELNTIVVEHVGLVAVTIEVLLLSLVLAFQFGELQRATGHALATAQAHLRLAHTDSLTGLPNRHAFEEALRALPAPASLTAIDLDGLKEYNDRHGHAQGDRLLCEFGVGLAQGLHSSSVLYRLGGDEFAVIATQGNGGKLDEALVSTVQTLRRNGFANAGASWGTAHLHEVAGIAELQHLADSRMYEHKRQGRTVREADATAGVASSAALA